MTSKMEIWWVSDCDRICSLVDGWRLTRVRSATNYSSPRFFTILFRSKHATGSLAKAIAPVNSRTHEYNKCTQCNEKRSRRPRYGSTPVASPPGLRSLFFTFIAASPPATIALDQLTEAEKQRWICGYEAGPTLPANLLSAGRHGASPEVTDSGSLVASIEVCEWCSKDGATLRGSMRGGCTHHLL